MVNCTKADPEIYSVVIAPLILDRADIEALLPPMPDIVSIVKETYRQSAAGQVDSPTKIGVQPKRPLSFLHAMPALLRYSGEIGMKWVSYFPGSEAASDSDATAIMILNEPEAGRPVAIMEAMHFTNARTAACGILAAELLAPADPKHLGLIGCGALPSWTAPELAGRFPSLKTASVTSKRASSRETFARKLSAESGLEVAPVDSVREAIEGADIVLSAIPQGPPPIARGRWLKPGALVIAFDILGTWDDHALARFGLLATDGLPRLENIMATKRTSARLPDRVLSFDELAAAGAPIDRPLDQLVLAVPSGLASLDVAIAWEIYRRAVTEGRGRTVELF